MRVSFVVVLLCMLLLPTFGQEPLTVPRRPPTAAPPRVTMNPMMLRRAYDDLTREQTQIDSILSRIDETRDARLAETLRMQKAMLTEQLADIVEQLQQQGLELPESAPQTPRIALPAKPEPTAPDIFFNAAPATHQTRDEIASFQKSVESLRGEVAALRNDIANLTAMVQILTRSLAQPANTSVNSLER